MDGAKGSAFAEAGEADWADVATCAERVGTYGKASVALYADAVDWKVSDESVLRESEAAETVGADARDFDTLSSGAAEDTVEVLAGDNPNCDDSPASEATA
jgi:hypothetical protein